MVSYEILTLAEVKEFINKLDIVRRARIDRFYELFKLYGNSLPSKYLKKMEHSRCGVKRIKELEE
ncbi:hypothetical protein HYT02_05630 [Candidatus Gottesmanbacteria bacterium]|nr:hypothetical protein [Candidatus Gottesmanbacteria bacterium]